MNTITIDRAASEKWVAENPGASEAYEKWSTGQPFRTDLATWHAFRAGVEWKSQTHPLGFQTRRAIKAEDELRAAQNEIDGLNRLLNAAYVDPANRATQRSLAAAHTDRKGNTMKAAILAITLLTFAIVCFYASEAI